MAHKSQKELADSLREAAKKVKVGASYVHYKAPELRYEVTGLVIEEASDEPMVLYCAQYGENIIFARPLASWLEMVEQNGEKQPRFIKVDS